MRRSIPTTADTNVAASLTRVSTFSKGYMTGPMEMMDKMSDAFSG
jgi:hypothetical protein